MVGVREGTLAGARAGWRAKRAMAWRMVLLVLPEKEASNIERGCRATTYGEEKRKKEKR